MPTYTVQLPDGRKVDISGPEGATAEQLGAAWNADPRSKQPAINPTADMSTGERLAAGAGKAVSDIGLGARQLGGLAMDYLRPRASGQPTRSDILNQEAEETRRRDAPLMDTTAGMIGNIGGNVATALLPGGFAIQAGKQLTKIPAAARLAEALMAGGKSFMAPTTIPGALGVGAVQGALQPTTSGGERLGNMALGGVAGAAVPTLVRGGQVARALTDPFSEAGQARIIGRAMNTAAGNEAPQALLNLQGAAPLVAGSMPTAGQAASNPGIAALERTAVATDPVAMNEMAKRLLSQNDARLSALQGIAPDRTSSVLARENATNALYGAADPQQLAVTPELQALLQRPSMQTAVSDAQKLAAEKGATLNPDALTGEQAHYIKRALDDITNSPPQQGFGQNQINAVRDTRTAYLNELEKQIPEYGQARQTFAQMSRPVNQADVVQDIVRQAQNFRGDVTPAAFARALQDKTAQRVTGQANATLGGVMEPSQMQTLDAIKQDLLRADYANTAGKGVGSDTVQKLAYSNLLDQAGVPSLVRALPGAGTIGGIAQRVGKRAYQDANDQMRTRLAQALLDPSQAAALMDAGMVSPQMVQAMNKARRIGAGAGALAPALANSVAPQELYLGQ